MFIIKKWQPKYNPENGGKKKMKEKINRKKMSIRFWLSSQLPRYVITTYPKFSCNLST